MNRKLSISSKRQKEIQPTKIYLDSKNLFQGAKKSWAKADRMGKELFSKVAPIITTKILDPKGGMFYWN